MNLTELLDYTAAQYWTTERLVDGDPTNSGRTNSWCGSSMRRERPSSLAAHLVHHREVSLLLAASR